MKSKQFRKILITLIVLLSIASCNKSDEEAIQAFLDQNSVTADSLIGDWTWINSHGGGWGITIRTPETEGYSKTISFSQEGNYTEFIDNEIDLETYYRIDTIRYDSEDRAVYKISYYSEKFDQNFLFETENDTIRLFIHDNCRDCVGTHVYIKD